MENTSYIDPGKLQHLAFAYYRRQSEEGGYLKDFQMTMDYADNVMHLTATVVSNGERLRWSIGYNAGYMETAIDDYVLDAIRKMVRQAKSLSEPELI